MAQSKQDAFIDRWSDLAIAIAKDIGVAPEVVLGQTALETGWGRSIAGNNLFGVKGKGQNVVTHEDIPGRGLVKTTESFRAYDNPVDSFKDYGNLLGKDRYSGVVNGLTVADQIAAIGKSGYATDRNYASKLSSVVDRIQDNKAFQDRVVNDVAALDPAEPDFTGVPFGEDRFDDFSTQIDPVPTGTVDFLGAVDDPFIAAPTGYVDQLGPLPDLTPYADINPISYDQPIGPPDILGFGPFNDFSTDPLQAGFSLPAPAAPSFDDVALGSYPDITAGIPGFDPMMGISPVEAAPVNLSDVPTAAPMSQDVFDAAFTSPPSALSMDFGQPAQETISPVGALGMGSAFGVEATPRGPGTGFAQGFNSDTPTPDFNAQSFDSWRNEDIAQAKLETTNRQNRIENEDIAASLMSEFGTPTADLEAAAFENERAMGAFNQTAATGWGLTPSGLRDQEAPLSLNQTTPGAVGFGSFAPTPTQAITSDVPMGDFSVEEAPRSFSQPAIPSATGKPASVGSLPTADVAPATPATTAPTEAPSLSNGFGLGSLFGGKSMPDQGFMDAMANPDLAKGYSPGVLDGWTGGALKGAGFGALTGGPLGALLGGAFGALNLDGRMGSAFTNQFGGFTGFDGFDGYDFDTMNYGLGYNARGERSHTGVNDSGNATVGDGSYGSQSGTNSNNPQGIL